MARPTGFEPVTPAFGGQEYVFFAVHGRSQGSEIIDIHTLANDPEFR